MFKQTALPGVVEIQPRRFGDARGYLCETWNAARYAEGGITEEFFQDNLSYSKQKGTVRGLHYQLPPRGQAKLVSCIAGRILDVAVDLRPMSSHRGQAVVLELSAEQGNQMFVPSGFAHGFCTLEDDCVIAYKLSSAYAPEAERSIAFDDPDIRIDWPITRASAHLSERDANAISLGVALAELDGLA
ncbi:MAG: dTDP-4-dehydrorhamnose 3,5-epimerase [Pseudomonadota bacterium]